MIAFLAAASIAFANSTQPPKCPTKTGQILYLEPATKVYESKPPLLDPHCRTQVAELLESEIGKIHNLDIIAYYFVRERLADLHSQCRFRNTTAFKAQAREIAREGAKLMQFSEEFTPMASADADIDSRGFARSFQNYSKTPLASNIVTQNPLVVPEITSGVNAGAAGNYSLAEVKFREALSHANSPYPLPEAFYFLGVTRFALGKRSTAGATWCAGVRLIFFQHSDSISNLNWNLLIAHRLAEQ